MSRLRDEWIYNRELYLLLSMGIIDEIKQRHE